MSYRLWVSATVALTMSLVKPLFPQDSASWRDPSPHTVQFVTVDDNVKLEVLDWGGSGRPLVLLAGEGGSAHVFDDFARNLTSDYHVYGITRRGYGASSGTTHGYSADRLGDDVLAVLDALKLNRPVLVGHSIAGEELSSVGSRRPERIAGLIYLDAAYSYAFYDVSHGDLDIDLNVLREQINRLQLGAGDQTELTRQLLQMTIPALEKDLKQTQDEQAGPPEMPNPPPPTAADLESFSAYRAYQKRVLGWPRSEANLRGQFELTPDGHLGKSRLTPEQHDALMAGKKKYTSIGVPVLAIFASPADPGPYAHVDGSDLLAAFQAYDSALTKRQAEAVRQAAPSARVVLLAQANHAIFLSNEADVIREMRTFLETLN
jgi:non-heme chloroperoxidase